MTLFQEIRDIFDDIDDSLTKKKIINFITNFKFIIDSRKIGESNPEEITILEHLEPLQNDKFFKALIINMFDWPAFIDPEANWFMNALDVFIDDKTVDQLKLLLTRWYYPKTIEDAENVVKTLEKYELSGLDINHTQQRELLELADNNLEALKF